MTTSRQNCQVRVAARPNGLCEWSAGEAWSDESSVCSHRHWRYMGEFEGGSSGDLIGSLLTMSDTPISSALEVASAPPGRDGHLVGKPRVGNRSPTRTFGLEYTEGV
jgi:hypothetical protein